MSNYRISFPIGLITRSTWFALSTLSILSLAFLIEPTKQSLGQTIPSKDTSLVSAKPATASFIDNTKTFTTKNPVHSSIRAIIANHLKSGYERFDFTLVESILASDFVFSYVTDGANIRFDDRRAYIAERKGWAEWQATRRSLLYSIQDMDSDEAGRYVSVAAYSTYETKYFSPRYLENLLFEKIKGKWMLKRQVLVPLYPNRPELYDVQIFVVKPCDVSERKFQELAITHGVDAFVDQCLKGSYDSLPYEAGALVLFVFREPPPVGAEIRTELIYERTYGEFPFDFSYKVRKSDPYFVIANDVYSEDLDGWFIMRVYVDGIKVGERKIGA